MVKVEVALQENVLVENIRMKIKSLIVTVNIITIKKRKKYPFIVSF